MARDPLAKCFVENGIGKRSKVKLQTPEERMSWYLHRWNKLKDIKDPDRWQSYAIVLTEQRLRLIQKEIDQKRGAVA